MARAEYVPITGSVLRWARLEAGLTRDALASKVKGATAAVIEAWEDETAHPTKTQFRALVGALKRPSAIFFAPEPPEPTPVAVAFRRNEKTANAVSPDELNQVRTARQHQLIAEWLINEGNIRERSSLPSVPDPSLATARWIAEDVRSTLGISFQQQCSFGTASSALREWKNAAESVLNVLIFQMQFPRTARNTRGFSLPSEDAPVVVLNTTFNEQARIFTLFHEIAHLVLGDAAVCDAWRTRKTRSEHERWAEEFSAELLLPAKEFSDVVRAKRASSSRLTVADVKSIARLTNVSARAVALRCIELSLATWALYEDVVEEIPNVDYKEEGGGGGGETTPYKRLREVGTRWPSLIFKARDEDLIGHYDVLKYLDMNTSQAKELEAALRDRA